MRKCEYHEPIKENVIYYIPQHDRENDSIIFSERFAIYSPHNLSMNYFMIVFRQGKPRMELIDILYEGIAVAEVYDLLVLLYQQNVNAIEVYAIEQNSFEVAFFDYLIEANDNI